MKNNIPLFFQPKTIYDVMLPDEISNRLNQITFAPKDGVVARKRKDRVMLLLSEMVNKHQIHTSKHKHNNQVKNLKSIPIHRDKWIEIAGDNRYYQNIPSLLISNGIITPYLDFNGEHVYCKGEFSRGYAIPKNMMNGEGVRIRLSKPVIHKAEPSVQQLWLVETYKNLSFPTMNEVIEESINQIGKKTKRNQTIIPHSVYVLLDDKTPYVDLDVHLDQYEALMNNGLMEPHYQPNGRMIDSICGLPSWIRDKMIKLNGKKLKRVDFKALHHNEWYRIFRDIEKKKIDKKEYKDKKDKNIYSTYNVLCFLPESDKNDDIDKDIDNIEIDSTDIEDNIILEQDKNIYSTYNVLCFLPESEMAWWKENCCGDGHSGIARALLKMEGNDNPSDAEIKDARDYVKLESLSHYNTTAYSMRYNEYGEMNRMASLFDANVPTLWKLIQWTKCGPYGYCNTSRILTRMEASIIQQAILELKKLNIHCVYVHDCLMVEEGNEYKCQEIMNGIVAEMGIPTYAEIDNS